MGQTLNEMRDGQGSAAKRPDTMEALYVATERALEHQAALQVEPDITSVPRPSISADEHHSVQICDDVELDIFRNALGCIGTYRRHRAIQLASQLVAEDQAAKVKKGEPQ